MHNIFVLLGLKQQSHTHCPTDLRPHFCGTSVPIFEEWFTIECNLCMVRRV